MLLSALLGLGLALVPLAAGGQASNQGSNQPGNQGSNQGGNVPAGATQDFHALLAKQCPDSHLEWLSQGELDDLIEVNFHDSLSQSLQSRLDAAYGQEKQACANLTQGLSCINIAYIKAMGDAGLLPRFTKVLCESGLICRAPADCGR